MKSKSINFLKIENKNVDNSYATEETDEVVMKAAFSRVAEHFGLSSPEGNLDNSQTYYGVYIPSDSNLKSSDEETLHVYTEKAEALKIMKQSKKARLKQFKTKKEAIHFVVHGAETLPQGNSLQCASGGEKVMPFKCPKVQDMIIFKKAIENNDVEEVRRKITDNPRYLVSSGDTPSILQEGPRYNALHIAAKSKNLEVVKIILDSVTNVDFISHLYDDNDVNSCEERIKILLDLYLNMPDKGLNETPLHIAVKHGAVDIVEYLTSFPQCQRNLINKFNQQPKDIICARVNNPSEAVKDAIANMLEEQYYIPVLRDEDNILQPRVGETFSPLKPLNLTEDLLSPRVVVRAYAGPMSEEIAEIFKKKWKSPLRSAKNSSQSSYLKLRDVEKGLERVGRNLALELTVPWKEYWPFLDTFVDLSSEEGLQMLEQYLKRRFDETWETVNNGGNLDSGEKVVSPMTALCEAMRFCSLNDDSTIPTKKLKWGTWNTDKHESHRKVDDNFESDAKHPLLYFERACEVIGKRVASAITSCDLNGVQTECIKDSLEIQVKHLMSNIVSYREDNRFQSINFQMVHSRVAAVAVYSLEDFTDTDRRAVLNSLKSIDWSDGTLSDDEDSSYGYKNLNQEVIGNSVKQHLHCLVKNIICELNAYNRNSSAATAKNEADCTRLWALASPCCCSWSLNTYFRPRIGNKRKCSKYLRPNFDCDIRSSFRDVLTEETSEGEQSKTSSKVGEEDEEEVYCTPPSGPSDSEDESMEDPLDLPDTFIYEGSIPSKIDFEVLDAIDGLTLTSDRYPNICRWKHLVNLHLKSSSPASGNSTVNLLNSVNKKRTPPHSSPGKILNKSFGSCEPLRRGGTVEPWERILGPYSPSSPKRAARLLFSSADTPVKR
ncbi:UNVERIFIED_CONTAM: hypothetical protein PYX00_006045 [Menopon gallinae]